MRPALILALALSVLPPAAALIATAAPARAEAPAAAPPAADAQARIAALADLLMADRLFAVMQAEGVEHGATLEEEMFAGRGGPAWTARVSAIYDPVRMRRELEAGLLAELGQSPERLDGIAGFLASDLGQRVLGLELSAREALLDEAAEEAAKVAAADLAREGDPLVDRVKRFVEVNDLIELNVASALNANLAFYRGMSEGGAFGAPMPEDDMLAEVWGQEGDVRSETESWLLPYLTLAYGPLSPEDLDAYTDFSASADGQALNAAVFAAFETMFARISGELGRAAADVLAGDDI